MTGFLLRVTDRTPMNVSAVKADSVFGNYTT
jgi:hypothetical protein